MNPVCRELLEAALQVYPQKRASSHKLKYFIDKALIPQAQTIGKGYAYTPTNIKFGQNTTNTTNTTNMTNKTDMTNITNKTDMTNIGHITNLNNNTNNTNTNNINNGFINFNGNTNSYNNAKNNQQFQFVKPQSCTNISWQESNNNNNTNHNFNYFPLQKPVTPIYQRNFAQQYHMVNPESSRQF